MPLALLMLLMPRGHDISSPADSHSLAERYAERADITPLRHYDIDDYLPTILFRHLYAITPLLRHYAID